MTKYQFQQSHWFREQQEGTVSQPEESACGGAVLYRNSNAELLVIFEEIILLWFTMSAMPVCRASSKAIFGASFELSYNTATKRK